MARSDSPWYRDGLAFECTRCGNCCTGAPGYVWVTEAEITRLAARLGLPREEFGRRYLRRVGPRLSLIERPNGDCIFWDRQDGCTVYEDRPEQCRTWPFWPQNLESERAWKNAGRHCPGIDRGAFFSLEQIEAAARRTPR
jgi:Fe-S-cluster containining protein